MSGAYSDAVVCKLHVVNLQQAAQSYCALSYSWQVDETRQPPQTISCNGRDIQVGKNLFDGLRRVRNTTLSFLIWADALCINQNDVEERSSQVSRMGEIFSSAYEVIAWLGEEALPSQEYMSRTFGASAVLSDLCTIVNTWRQNNNRFSLVPKATFGRRSQDGKYASCSPLSRDGFVQYWWEETLQIFSRRWFHRVWVIQEVALARSARILLGEYEISWDVVGLAASILRTNFNTLVPTIRQNHTRKTLLRFRTGVLNAYFMYRLSRSQSHTERMRPDFHQLLILTRSFECQDDRDRIYGLLGLPFSRPSLVDSGPKPAPFIVPNYSKSTAQVYLEVAEKILLDSCRLRLLSSVQRPSPRASSYCGTFDVEASSWVPQWSFSETQSLTPFDESEGFDVARLRDGLDIPIMHVIPLPGPAKLRVRGIDITAVSTVSTVGYGSDFCIPWWATDKDQGIVMGIDKGRMVQYPLEPTGEITDAILSRNSSRQNLTEIAMILTGGNDWHGRPVTDETAHVLDLAKLLLEGGLLWTMGEDTFGTDGGNIPDEGYHTKHAYRKTLSDAQMQQMAESMGEWASEGNGTRFLDAAGTVGNGRRRFTTDSGLRGVGPGAMEPGDSVCVVQGASAPFVLRNSSDECYEVIGECYVYVAALREGETAQEALMRDFGFQETWLDLM